MFPPLFAGLGSKTLADFFYDEATCLHSLKMTHCSLKCSDVFTIAKGLVEHTYDEFKNMPTHQLVKWYLDNNMIKGSGAEAISHYLKVSTNCWSSFDHFAYHVCHLFIHIIFEEA